MAKEVVLLEHVVEEKVKMLEPACSNCGAAAKMKCTQCGAAICSTACANERWTEHKPKCRARQAAEFGREFARRENRGYRFTHAALHDDTATMQKLVDELTAALAKNKKLKKF